MGAVSIYLTHLAVFLCVFFLSFLQYLEELERIQESGGGIAAMPGKQALVPAQQAAEGIGELGKGALRPLVSLFPCCLLPCCPAACCLLQSAQLISLASFCSSAFLLRHSA
jgi:hypothetical protein